eukprot:268673_1
MSRLRTFKAYLNYPSIMALRHRYFGMFGKQQRLLLNARSIQHPFYNLNRNRYTSQAHETNEETHQTQETPPFKPERFENYVLPHPIWTTEELESVVFTHKQPTKIVDYLAYGSVLTVKSIWDLSTGYTLGRKWGLFNFTSRMWLLRIVFLETVAGVPGMMFGMVRHLNSLRRMERDRGWINCLLSEAENERIHLLTAMRLYKAGRPLRYAVVVVQGVMCAYLLTGYLISPRYCHSFVGYLEEQAVHTYTNLLHDIDQGKYPEFEVQAPILSRGYWRLPPYATWRDVFNNMRCDEAKHREVNHCLAELTGDKLAVNPFRVDGLHPSE